MINLGSCAGAVYVDTVIVGCCVGTTLSGGSGVFHTLVSGDGGGGGGSDL